MPDGGFALSGLRYYGVVWVMSDGGFALSGLRYYGVVRL
ncbi:Uncharacterised protein [Citrobacter koseri]|nr:Uncharacterised protein [Citrobacter koseri]